MDIVEEALPLVLGELLLDAFADALGMADDISLLRTTGVLFG